MTEERHVPSQSIQERLGVVGELTTLIIGAYDLNRVFRDAILRVREVLDFRRASIALVSADRTGYSLHTLYDEARGVFTPEDESFALGWGLTGRVIATGEPIVDNAFPGNRRIREPSEDAVSVLVVPLEVGGEVIGALTFGASRPGAYTDDDLRLARILAGQIGASLHQSRVLASAEERQHELEALIEASDAPVLMVRNGRVVHVNRAMAALAGRTRELLHGAPIDHVNELLAPRVADPATLSVELEADEANVAVRDRIEFTSPLPRTFVRTIAPVLDQEGGTVGQVVYYRDVTIEQQAERARDDFVSTVSHELRTPLASIKASLKLLSMGAAGEIGTAVQDYLDIALRNLERLIRLVNDLLDVSRLQRGKLDLRPSAVAVARAVTQAVGAVSVFAEERGVYLEIEPTQDELVVSANPDRFEQVLINLLSNAVKFSPEEGHVRVSSWRDGEFAVVEVADEGHGVPSDKREAIFESFHQLDGAARSAGGTGLGLAISREIVEGMEGRIWLDEGDEPGARFRVALPLLVAEESDR